jgi:hypothetical protein
MERLRLDGRFRHAFHALDLRPAEPTETTSRARGCALLATDRFMVEGEPDLLWDAPAPERSLMAALRLGEFELMAASFHVVAGSDRKKWGPLAKRQNNLAIATWMSTQAGPTVVGIDANSPKIDHPELRRNEYWGQGTTGDRMEHLLHDPSRAGADQPRHDLVDVLRRFLEANPEKLERAVSERRSGPLAVSHISRGQPRRYDFIFASTALHPVEVEYRWVPGASDHPLVRANLSV